MRLSKLACQTLAAVQLAIAEDDGAAQQAAKLTMQH
jgi:hypothetical protein